MFFQHIYDKTLAQASYFIGCQKAGVAMVIDPKRDVDTYLQIAEQNKMKITHIAETHIHADFLSGARELASLTGGQLFLSDEGGEGWQYEFDHVGLKDGDTFMVGNLKLEVMHTPGHTPESISFLLTDTPASPEPVMFFTGDFIFVGDIGRPDLLEKAAGFEGTKEAGAKQMYKSIQRAALLDDHIQLWPGHGAGSACGKALGAVPSSTIGYEKKRNWAFKFANDEQGFIDYLLADQPEPPRYFAMMKKLNKVNRPLLTEVPALKQLSYDELAQALEGDVPVVDTRNKTLFAEGFIPGTINIQGNNAFATWAGWFLQYNQPFVLIAEPETHDDLVRKLMRIGLDNIMGYVPNVQIWEAHGKSLEKANLISLQEFEQALVNNNLQVVDLRGETEYNSGHIKGANHVFIGTLDNNLDKVKLDKNVVIHCQGGDRASIGYSLLRKKGFTNVKNYVGGINEWTGAGNSLEFDLKN